MMHIETNNFFLVQEVLEMEQLESLVKTAVEEIEKVLNTDTVVGKPINLEGTTLVPLVEVGFGFGAGGGGGKGKGKQEGEGTGGGVGGGVGIKPIAMVMVDQAGARLVTIKGGIAGAIESIGDSVPKAMAQCMEKLFEKWDERKEAKKEQ
jgi:uncharacterized spore protein YtfJ